MKEKSNIKSKSHFKFILKKGSWYFLVSIVTKALTILLLPVITRHLSKVEYGVLNSLNSIAQLLPLFISLQLDAAYYRFYFNYNKSKDELKTFVSTYFWFILFWGIIVVALSILAGKIFLTDIFEISFFPYIPLVMIGPLFMQLSALGNSYLKQQFKSFINSVIRILTYVVYLVLFMYLLIGKKMGVLSKLYALFIQNVLLFICFIFFLLKDKLIGFRFNKKLLIEGLKYSVFLLPNAAASWIAGLSDRIIIAIFKDLGETGLYSVGYQLGQTLTMFTNAIFSVYTPIMFTMLVNKKEEGIKRIEKFIPFYFFVMFWLAFCIGVFSKEVVIILTDPRYHLAYVVTPIVAYAYFCGAMYKPFVNIISFKKKTWIISSGAILQALSNIIFNIIFIPIFGKMAAAWTTLGSLFVYFIWLFLWSQRLERIKIGWKKIIITICVGIIVFAGIKILNIIIPYNYLVVKTYDLFYKVIQFQDIFFIINFKRIIFVFYSLIFKIALILAAFSACIKFKLIDIKNFKIKKKNENEK